MSFPSFFFLGPPVIRRSAWNLGDSVSFGVSDWLGGLCVGEKSHHCVLPEVNGTQFKTSS